MNRYMNPNINKYFGQFGVSVPDNAYGLSEMVQFIWRSAIRNGEMIYLLIPSKRMYDILMDWLSVIEGCPNFRRIGCSEELIRWLCRKIPGYGKFLAEKASATNGEETVMVTLPLPATGYERAPIPKTPGLLAHPYILRCAHRAGGNRYIKYLNYKLTNSMLKKSSYYATILINRIGASLFERSDNYKRKKER